MSTAWRGTVQATSQCNDLHTGPVGGVKLRHQLVAELSEPLLAVLQDLAGCRILDQRRVAAQVRDLEKVLLRMWDIHCEGRGPRPFQVR